MGGGGGKRALILIIPDPRQTLLEMLYQVDFRVSCLKPIKSLAPTCRAPGQLRGQGERRGGGVGECSQVAVRNMMMNRTGDEQFGSHCTSKNSIQW